MITAASTREAAAESCQRSSKELTFCCHKLLINPAVLYTAPSDHLDWLRGDKAIGGKCCFTIYLSTQLLIPTSCPSLFVVTGQVESENQMMAGEEKRSMSLHIFFLCGSVSWRNSPYQVCRQLCWCNARCRNSCGTWTGKNGQNTMTELPSLGCGKYYAHPEGKQHGLRELLISLAFNTVKSCLRSWEASRISFRYGFGFK